MVMFVQLYCSDRCRHSADSDSKYVTTDRSLWDTVTLQAYFPPSVTNKSSQSCHSKTVITDVTLGL